MNKRQKKKFINKLSSKKGRIIKKVYRINPDEDNDMLVLWYDTRKSKIVKAVKYINLVPVAKGGNVCKEYDY